LILDPSQSGTNSLNVAELNPNVIPANQLVDASYMGGATIIDPAFDSSLQSIPSGVAFDSTRSRR
jgi:hypothetical protein